MSNATVLPPANLASAPIRASLFDIKCFVPQQNINQNLVHFFLTSVLHCRLDSVRVLTSVDPMRLWPSWERNAIQGVVLVDLAKGSYDSFIFLQNQFWTKHLLMTSNLEPMNLWNIKTISNHWLTLLMRTPTTLLAATAKGCLLALLLWRACGILRILDLTAKEAWKGSIIFDGIPIFTYNLAQVIFVDTPKVVNDQHLKKKHQNAKAPGDQLRVVVVSQDIGKPLSCQLVLPMELPSQSSLVKAFWRHEGHLLQSYSRLLAVHIP